MAYNLIQNSERPGWWTLADTENNIAIRWEEHRYNDTQEAYVLDDTIPTTHTAADLARIMREMGDYVVRHHGGIAFDVTFGFEFAEDDKDLYLCRYKEPMWRMKLQSDNINSKKLADSLRKAAEFLNKR